MIPQEIQEKIRSVIQEKGCKLTSQRSAVLKAFFEKNYEHMTVEEVHYFSKSYCSKIGIATVYRCILSFEKIGVLRKIETNEKYGRYELVIPDEKFEHPHLVCVKCGKIIGAFDSEILKELDKQKKFIENIYDFKINSQSNIYYGICEACKDA
ncbi:MULTISPECIES: Fur family transcriptional regulator [Clostridium]|uniref:Ferric uptake regulation protein n=4 Tax=Clostridium TaxID=1485 RepID=D8GIS8_CLOLD|nr:MULTISPECIES: transcriptional repressor [Clostridium]ADK15003.1 ferric uptake regulation protein [Clostridium ljungdahlii DSM 13528]AGY74255.1 transcriptional repressor [Clostridium autoethanogenum DSM 10061]ALU34446.1 Ferric uptake regulator Fur family [Clostridium autoethanogenum DSM 10061]OAA87664.1 Ferric uptake regulation protein [Clostridium ljungdahlii DSM 13528]OAA93979.1 Ferric uptake regulation protein [Clostridium coskatii]